MYKRRSQTVACAVLNIKFGNKKILLGSKVTKTFCSQLFRPCPVLPFFLVYCVSRNSTEVEKNAQISFLENEGDGSNEGRKTRKKETSRKEGMETKFREEEEVVVMVAAAAKRGRRRRERGRQGGCCTGG